MYWAFPYSETSMANQFRMVIVEGCQVLIKFLTKYVGKIWRKNQNINFLHLNILSLFPLKL
jgi:hypothetical protein